MIVLVTGGTGYIGSHTVVELIKREYEVIIVDNYSNSKPEVLNRIEAITGKRPKFYNVNILNKAALQELFKRHQLDAVIHFAGHKAVGESVEQPLSYYHNNLVGTLVLCELMESYNVHKLVFSSSATVYGTRNDSPLTEEMTLCATNPYGQTKIMIERIIKDICKSDSKWSAVSLRYFNPIGAHESGLIGEDPNGIPDNLVPYITQVAVGKLNELLVFGDNYSTNDGTGVRDYIHVVDLARGHVNALDYIFNHVGAEVINLGTGQGYSVIEVVKSFERANKLFIPYKIVERRLGDVAMCFADVSKAKKLLDWSAKMTLDEMCRDAWHWQQKNPNGYEV